VEGNVELFNNLKLNDKYEDCFCGGEKAEACGNK
jgi:hypothetical protein